MANNTRPVRLDARSIQILDQGKHRLYEFGVRRPSYNEAVRLLAGEPIKGRGGRRGRELVLVGLTTPSWLWDDPKNPKKTLGGIIGR